MMPGYDLRILIVRAQAKVNLSVGFSFGPVSVKEFIVAPWARAPATSKLARIIDFPSGQTT